MTFYDILASILASPLAPLFIAFVLIIPAAVVALVVENNDENNIVESVRAEHAARVAKHFAEARIKNAAKRAEFESNMSVLDIYLAKGE